MKQENVSGWGQRLHIFVYTLGRPLSPEVFFSFGNSSYKLSRTIAAVSAKWSVINVLQNITTN